MASLLLTRAAHSAGAKADGPAQNDVDQVRAEEDRSPSDPHPGHRHGRDQHREHASHPALLQTSVGPAACHGERELRVKWRGSDDTADRSDHLCDPAGKRSSDLCIRAPQGTVSWLAARRTRLCGCHTVALLQRSTSGVRLG